MDKFVFCFYWCVFSPFVLGLGVDEIGLGWEDFNDNSFSGRFSQSSSTVILHLIQPFFNEHYFLI